MDTTLLQSVFFRDSEKVQHLIFQNFDVNISGPGGKTALMFAAMRNSRISWISFSTRGECECN